MDKKTQKIADEIVEQILAVRNTGEANMFDIRAVMKVAYDLELYKLVTFLDDRKNQDDYYNFIFNGKDKIVYG